VTYACALFLSFTFVALARRLGLVTRPFEVIATSKEAYRVFMDSTLNDDVKEAIMQQSAKTLARQFVFISAASVAAAAAPLGVVWLLADVGLVSLTAVVGALLSWKVLFTGTLMVAAKAWYDRVRVLGTH
jgi:hypothetical protein